MDILRLAQFRKKYILIGVFIITYSVTFFILDVLLFDDKDLFSRSGSITVAICLLFASFDIKEFYSSFLRGEDVNAIKVNYEAMRGKTAEWIAKQSSLKSFHVRYYTSFAILGTLVWGYGDLLTDLFRLYFLG